MKELSRLQPRHAWRCTESEHSTTKLKASPYTKFLPTFLLICWTIRSAAAQGTAIPLNDGDIRQIVDAHNLFRSMVEPPASNMQRIEWNSDLAMVAQNYAEMCRFDPNPNRATQAPFDTVGENRAFGRTTNYTDLIDRGWFVRRINYNFSSNMCLSPGACDEYTQLVWAESNLVGCGAANCETVEGPPLPTLRNTVAFVCNYAPEGNIPGQLPYEAGLPCSQCPDGMNFCVQNSCSSVDITSPLMTTTQAPEPPTTTEEQPDETTTTQAVATTTEQAITTEELPVTTEEQPTTVPPTTSEQTPAIRTTTPTPPCPPTISPPIIVIVKPPTTKKPVTPTSKPPINWYLIWLTIKYKSQRPYTVWPWLTLKPDRTRTRSRGGRRKSGKKTRKISKTRRRGSKSGTRTRKGSKSKCTKSRKRNRKLKSRRMRGRG